MGEKPRAQSAALAAAAAEAVYRQQQQFPTPTYDLFCFVLSFSLSGVQLLLRWLIFALFFGKLPLTTTPPVPLPHPRPPSLDRQGKSDNRVRSRGGR